MSDILKEFRFLVDVPAIENPDFAEAVQKMTQSTPAAQESTQDITQESPEEEEHTEEPLEEHSCKKKTGRTLTGASDAGRAGDEPVSDRKETGDNTKHGIVQAKTAAKRKCGTCRFRQTTPYCGNCNYLSIAGHSRGCPIIGCTRYEKGTPPKKRK